jgi:hypothetical protein
VLKVGTNFTHFCLPTLRNCPNLINADAHALATDVLVVVHATTDNIGDSTSKAAENDELSTLLNWPVPQEAASSPIKPSALFPANTQDGSTTLHKNSYNIQVWKV